MSPDEIDRLATRLFTSIERGDLDAVASLYAPDVEVWHNVGGNVQTRDENLRLLKSLRDRIGAWRYDEVRRDLFEGGFVQQHVLRADPRDDGEPIEIPVCILVRASEGLITRIDEYLDSSAAAPLLAR